MKPGEIREKTLNELQKLHADLEEELFRLNFRHSTGQLQQTSNIRKTRKDLARVKTIIVEKTQKVAS